MTMTIVGYDPRTGQFGGAVATKNIAVGSRVLRGMGEVGMVGFSSVETQRRRGLALLQLGFPAPVALEALIKVSNGSGQYSIIDRNGVSASYSSPSLLPWRGSRHGKNYACGANTMVGPEVVQALGDTFEATEDSGLPLEERLLMCMEAAQATGGDNRGRQSCAIQVHWKRIDANPYLDIRVDDHPNPIPEMRSIVHIYRGAYPTYSSRTWPELEGTGGYPILYPGD
jgi:uncharacterized Ntn-hydrolase superfamily protein